MTFSGNTGLIDGTGPVNKATFKSQFLVPVKDDIEALQATVAMAGPQFLAGDVTASAVALVQSGGVVKPMSLAEILKVSASLRPYVSKEDLGMMGDGVTDDAPALQRGYDLWSARGGAVFMLKAEPGQSFFFKGTPRGASNITTIFFSPHTVTSKSRVTLMGSMATDPAATDLALLADTSAGATSFTLDTSAAGGGALTSRLAVDDMLLLKGLRDSCGTALEEQMVRVTGLNDGTNTVSNASDPFDYAFEVSYTAGDYEAAQLAINKTTVSRVISARATANVAAGSNLWPIATGDVGKFTEGDYVMVYDEKRCSDVFGSNNSLINIEIARIVPSVSGDATASLRLSRNIERAYTTAKFARLIKLDPIINASIEGATVEFTQVPDAVVHAFEGRYAVDCAFANCNVPNTDIFGTKGNAFRLLYSLSSRIENCTARGARYVDDGQGNGAVIAWSTDCDVVGGNFDGMRHSLQWLGATNGSAMGVTVQNPRHTPFDWHGANEVGCVVYDSDATASTTYEAGATKAPPGIVFGNPTLLAGTHRCGFVGGRLKGFKDPTASIHEPVIQTFPPSTGNFVRDTEFVDIGVLFGHEDVSGVGTAIASGLRLDGISVDGCADWLIDIDGRANGASVDTLADTQIKNCEFRNIGKLVRATRAAELQFMNNRWDEITVDGSFPYVVLAVSCPNFYFNQNLIIGSQSGLRLESCTAFRVINNEFADQTAGTVFYDAGSNTGLWIDNKYPGYTPSTNRVGGSSITEYPTLAGKVTMADDTAFSFTPRRGSGCVQVWSHGASTMYGMCQYICLGTPDTDLVAGSTTANVARATGVLAGTTGTDTKFTISAHTDGRIYFENRTGGSLDIDASVF